MDKPEALATEVRLLSKPTPLTDEEQALLDEAAAVLAADPGPKTAAVKAFLAGDMSAAQALEVLTR